MNEESQTENDSQEAHMVNRSAPLAVAKTSTYRPSSAGFVETTFAETIGLSMHNAIVNQQSSQMTTSASITNACARLLQAPAVAAAAKKKEEAKEPEAVEGEFEEVEKDNKEKKKSIFHGIKKMFSKKGS